MVYTGPVIFKKNLKAEAYDNFLILHLACRLLSLFSTGNLIDYANLLLENFVEGFAILYGRHNISHNVHGLYHLSDDVKNHGTLNDFSAFPFENFMQKIKSYLRKPNLPLQQIYRRFLEGERKCFPPNQKIDMAVDGEIGFTDDAFLIQGTLFRKIRLSSGLEIIAGNSANNCIALNDEKIVLVEYIIKNEDGCFLLGKDFKNVNPLYKVSDFCSSVVGEYSVDSLSKTMKVWPVNAVRKKCFKFSRNSQKEIVITVLHAN